MSEINDLTKKVIKFRDVRDWKKFHNPKDLALSLTLEAAELLEHFQWKSKEEVEKYVKSDNVKEIEKEIADICIYLLYLCHGLKIDLKKAVEQKLIEQNKKYPVAKAKGRHTKYTKL